MGEKAVRKGGWDGLLADNVRFAARRGTPPQASSGNTLEMLPKSSAP
ncbi:hypothetical protein [Ensifer sp. Root142]|nr:hypothetical protein [Ensifer sp. Root142]